MAKLIGVLWDTDVGVVDLESRKIVMYIWSDAFDGKEFWIPTVEITDKYFNEYFDPSTVDARDPTWDNVVELLLHPAFGLDDRLVHPPTDEERRKP